MAERTFVPADFAVPAELISPPFRLEPLGPQHNDADYAAWTSSIEHIKGTPGFTGRDWPDPGMSPDDNLADLRGHADDFARRAGFTYTVIEIGSGEIIGCVYIYPPRPEDPAPPAEDQAPVGAGDQGTGRGENASAGAEYRGPAGGGDQHPAGSGGHGSPGGGHDAAVSSWVRADRASLDVALYEAVSAWLAAAWPFRAVRYAPR